MSMACAEESVCKQTDTIEHGLMNPMAVGRRKKGRRRGKNSELDTRSSSLIVTCRSGLTSEQGSQILATNKMDKNKIHGNRMSMIASQCGLKSHFEKRKQHLTVIKGCDVHSRCRPVRHVQDSSNIHESNVIECFRKSNYASNTAQPFKLIQFIGLLVLAIGGLIVDLIGNNQAQLQQVEALQITNFRVPSFVPNNLPTKQQQQQPAQVGDELAKPILFDCDYEYRPEEDARLTVRWFKNKEAEPFYQWLPELNVRDFADWIKPLVSQSFVSDPHDPMKRYRSLLIRRLSMNLTGQYTCLVSSLAGQDTRQSSLVVFQQPRSFTFEHRIYPAPAAFISTRTGSAQQNNLQAHQQLQQQSLLASRFNPQGNNVNHYNNQQQQQQLASSIGQSGGRSHLGQASDTSGQPVTRPPPNGLGASPTQFKGLAAGAPLVPGGPTWPATIIRPPNNNQQQDASLVPPVTTAPSQVVQATTKIVYTHDGRPIRRKYKREADGEVVAPISGWQLKKKLAGGGGGGDMSPAPVQHETPIRAPAVGASQNYAIQLHHFQCQASQVTPRPMVVLKVSRGPDSIVQYLHEASAVSIRPYQVSQEELFASLAGTNSSETQLRQHSEQLATGTGGGAPFMVTLYDITVSATVALNVSLAPVANGSRGFLPTGEYQSGAAAFSSYEQQYPVQQQQPPLGIETMLNYRRGQRMLFECHLEITGTDFEARRRISINETEVYQFAEAEEERRKMRLAQRVQYDQFNQQSLRKNKIHDSGGQQTVQDGAAGLLFSLGFGSSSSANGNSHTIASNNNNNNICLAVHFLIAAVATLWSFQNCHFAIHDDDHHDGLN